MEATVEEVEATRGVMEATVEEVEATGGVMEATVEVTLVTLVRSRRVLSSAPQEVPGY